MTNVIEVSVFRSMSLRLFATVIVAAAMFGGSLWAASADAAPLNVRGDSDAIHSNVVSVTSNFPNSGSTSENIDSLMDRNPTTKWYAGTGVQPTGANPVYAIYTLSVASEVSAYSLTSGNDAPERDAEDWTILGSNDPAAAGDAAHASWELLDTRSNQRFPARNQRNVYSIPDPDSYLYYQLRVTANLANSTASNNTKFQLADWTLRSGGDGFPSTILSPTTVWSYLEDGTVDPSPGADRTAWTQVGATPAGIWQDGLGPFGAKNGGTNLGAAYPVTTLLKHYLDGNANPTVPAYFFRTTFELDQAALDSMKGVYGTLVHDDAAALYINGDQAIAYNEGSTVNSNLQYAGGTLTDPRSDNFAVPSSSLRVGENVISIELHNVNATSSDIYFALPTLSATSDEVPSPFTPEELNATYDSDTMPVGDNGGNFYVDLLDGFNDLLANHPEAIAVNDNLPSGTTPTAANDLAAVAINNGAVPFPAKTAQATADANGSAYRTMADSFGDVLGPIYEQSLNAGQLPKTLALLSGMIEKGRNHEPAKAAYGYKRPYVRLGLIGGPQCGGWSGAEPRIEPTYTGSYNGLCGNGSFPSGHTNHGFAQGTVLATILPELAPQILARTSEYGNNRIVLGFHYPLDIISGRMAGQTTAQQRWSDPAFRDLLEQAEVELATVLGDKCVELGHSADLDECAADGSGVLSDSEALQIYTERLGYSSYTVADGTRLNGFPVSYPAFEDTPAEIPAGASDLLLSSFPALTDGQRELVLKATAIPGGYALDKTKDNKPSWQRLNLAAAMVADVAIDTMGNTIVNGENMGGGTAVVPEMTVTAGVGTYNKSAKITVDVSADGIEPDGHVQVNEGDAPAIAMADVVNGVATLRLPKTLEAGKHFLVINYVPDNPDLATPAPAGLIFTVKKASAKLAKVSISKGKAGKNKLRKGKKAKLKIQLKGVGAADPTGKVTLKIGSKTYGKAKVKQKGKKFIAVVKTKKLKKKGKLKVQYSGTTNLKKKTYKTKIRVK